MQCKAHLNQINTIVNQFSVNTKPFSAIVDLGIAIVKHNTAIVDHNATLIDYIIGNVHLDIWSVKDSDGNVVQRNGFVMLSSGNGK